VALAEPGGWRESQPGFGVMIALKAWRNGVTLNMKAWRLKAGLA